MAPACQRFDREWRAQLHDGAPAPPALLAHVQECVVCREALRLHDALVAALPGTGARRGPRAGWEGRVLEAARSPGDVRRPKRVAIWTAGLGFGLVAAGALLWWRSAPERPGNPVAVTSRPASVETGVLALDWTVVRGKEAVRSGSTDETYAAVGDTIRLEAHTGGAAHAEIRIFQSRGGLLFRCPPGPACSRAGDRLSARWRPAGPGTYQVFVVGSAAPLQPPQEDAAADSESLLRAGVDLRSGRPIRVR